MKRRLLAVLLIALLATPALAAPKRRTSGKPQIDPSTTGGWLVTNAIQLTTSEPNGFTTDLTPLRRMIGTATTVALGDDTHGTHEFFTVKLRLIDYLVRELGFEAITFEAPFPLFNELNDYVVTGKGDPRTILARAGGFDLGYYFWDTEEILALVQWMRDYNAHRGNRPVVEIAGSDIYDTDGAVGGVLTYLRPVDPVFAADAQQRYACVDNGLTPECRADYLKLHDELAAKRGDYEPRSSHRAYEDALHNAEIATIARGPRDTGVPVFQLRDIEMAANTLWVKQHRGTNEKVIVWMHQEHVGKTFSQITQITPMGSMLAQQLGTDYFVIGTLTGSGTFLTMDTGEDGQQRDLITAPFRPAASDSYEALFHSAGLPRLLIPLRGTLPDWLKSPHTYRSAGSGPIGPPGPNRQYDWLTQESLADKLDAVIYLEQTTAARPLTP